MRSLFARNTQANLKRQLRAKRRHGIRPKLVKTLSIHLPAFPWLNMIYPWNSMICKRQLFFLKTVDFSLTKINETSC
jgi:hypothetical protein